MAVGDSIELTQLNLKERAVDVIWMFVIPRVPFVFETHTIEKLASSRFATIPPPKPITIFTDRIWARGPPAPPTHYDVQT